MLGPLGGDAPASGPGVGTDVAPRAGPVGVALPVLAAGTAAGPLHLAGWREGLPPGTLTPPRLEKGRAK
eukprot:9086208-Lingulodinium_polyedra.AAC.1